MLATTLNVCETFLQNNKGAINLTNAENWKHSNHIINGSHQVVEMVKLLWGETKFLWWSFTTGVGDEGGNAFGADRGCE
jgi:hypothetical protein